jgi:L-iditol 2-dehydrogenase
VRVARFYAPGDVRVEDSPEPAPGLGEIKVRVRSCSVCGTDLKIARHGHPRIRPPRVPGHEIAGEIAELGSGVSDWSVGDRVQVIGAIPCGDCAQCRRGRMTVCANRQAMGYTHDGGFASYLIVPATVLAVGGLNRIPDGVGFTEASLAEPLACVLHAQEQVGIGSGDEVVVVVGTGPTGCLHVRLARARGARQVLMVGRGREHLARAADLVKPDGAICLADDDVTDRVLTATGGTGADAVIIAAASAQAQADALRYTAPRGRISLFGSPPPGEPPMSMDPSLVRYRELTITGSSGASPAQTTRALGLIASGEVPVADLITHRVPLARFHEALGLIERGEALKVTISPY